MLEDLARLKSKRVLVISKAFSPNLEKNRPLDPLLIVPEGSPSTL